MHTNYLFALGLDKSKIYGILDNAPHKIGKYLYGTDLKCLSFNDIIETTEDIVIILNGGCYNKEILNMFNNKPNITCV